MIYEDIDRLIAYGLQSELLPKEDAIYARNRLLALLRENDYALSEKNPQTLNLEDILKALLDEAVSRNIIDDSQTDRDLFDAKLMDCITPRPSQIQGAFWQIYDKSKERATDFYYKLSGDTDYIRRYRIIKDKKWKVNSEYGEIDITINLSKPEKDPKAIAAAKTQASSTYPKCLLCKENEGFEGDASRPARVNHRIIPLQINGKEWGFQYSPYVYYNEHCIVFNNEHTPMKINKDTFKNLIGFVKIFPHYFIGSNADLPIVGGSILSHDHYQGGRYVFAMEKAPYTHKFTVKGFEDVTSGIIKWPMSVIRLQSENEEKIIEFADRILAKWRGYTDEKACVYAQTDGEPHNTITPIARLKNGKFELDLVLRNNKTSEEYPLGIYHPHKQYHNIKKENIGLIEVMGLAVLPSRLEKETERLKKLLLENGDYHNDELTAKHAQWADCFAHRLKGVANADEAQRIIEEEIGKTFVKVLENAGVYKNTEEGGQAFLRFIDVL